MIVVIVAAIVYFSNRPDRAPEQPPSATVNAPAAVPQQSPTPTSESPAPPLAENKPVESDTIAAVPGTGKAPAPAVKHITDKPAENSSNDQPQAATATPEGVVQQVMPEVIPQAQRSITGKVRVKLALDVDSAGNVVSAKLVSPGPSKYFAKVAEEAARRWKFTHASIDSRSWNLEFDFRRSGTEVHSKQSK